MDTIDPKDLLAKPVEDELPGDVDASQLVGLSEVKRKRHLNTLSARRSRARRRRQMADLESQVAELKTQVTMLNDLVTTLRSANDQLMLQLKVAQVTGTLLPYR